MGLITAEQSGQVDIAVVDVPAVFPPQVWAWVSQSLNLQKAHLTPQWSQKWFLLPHCCEGDCVDENAVSLRASEEKTQAINI